MTTKKTLAARTKRRSISTPTKPKAKANTSKAKKPTLRPRKLVTAKASTKASTVKAKTATKKSLSFHKKLVSAFVVVALLAVGTIGVLRTTMSYASNITGPITGIGGKCLDNYARLARNGNKIQLYKCNDTPAQQWTIPGDGTIRVQGYCLDVPHASKTEKTYVQLYKCNGTNAQKWDVKSNGTIVSPISGLCLDDQWANTADENPIWMYHCNGTNAQKWTPPKTSSPTSTPPPAPAPKPAPQPSTSSNLPLLGVGGGNTDPSYLEKSPAGKLGVRRLYYHLPGGQAGAIAAIKADLAAGRTPWVSFKLDNITWARAKNGAADNAIKSFNAELVKLNLTKDVWVSIHHEPEGDQSNTADYRAMQDRLIPLISANSTHIKTWIILTGWHEVFGSDSFANYWPTKAKPYGIAIDPYNWYGTEGKTTWDELKIYYAKTKAFADSKGVKWGIAEFGIDNDGTNNKSKDGAHWIERAYKDAVAAGGCAALAYFDTNLNNPSGGDWRLSSNSAKQADFLKALALSKGM